MDALRAHHGPSFRLGAGDRSGTPARASKQNAHGRSVYTKARMHAYVCAEGDRDVMWRLSHWSGVACQGT
jgi:hypothetical protein